MEKTLNGKSNKAEVVEREKLSPAESSFRQKLCEVRPGVDLVKSVKSSYITVHSRIRITHVTCTE